MFYQNQYVEGSKQILRNVINHYIQENFENKFQIFIPSELKDD